MADASLKVLALSGSLRKGSFNTALARSLAALAPAGMQVEARTLNDIPLYDEDVKVQGFPAPVQALRQAIKAADGLIYVTPEYNYSYSGVLKNAIDWASRPPEHPFDGKPIAIVSASPGPFGGARAQYHLRQTMIFLNGIVMNRPELMVGQANTKLNDAGEVTDETTRQRLGELLAAFAQWIVRVRD